MLSCVLLQTEIPGVENLLGLKEGWSWMARFLNEIPATAPSATALHAFLKVKLATIYITPYLDGRILEV